MYLVKIRTKYNLIQLVVDDVRKLQELFEQSYVMEVYIETTQHYEDEQSLIKKLKYANIK